MSAKLVRVRAPKRKQETSPSFEQFNILLDPDDRFALEEASRIEKLSKSDVFRRALRAYYRKLLRTEQIAS